jgi:hypothetical protein
MSKNSTGTKLLAIVFMAILVFLIWLACHFVLLWVVGVVGAPLWTGKLLSALVGLTLAFRTIVNSSLMFLK